MSQDNVEVVRRLYEAFNRRDVEAASQLWAADGEWRPAFTGGGLVEGAIFRGHEGLIEFLEQQADSWESMVAEPVALREVGRDVLVHVQLRAVGRASGIAFEQTGWTVFRVLDGRVTGGRAYTSEADALEAVGQ